MSLLVEQRALLDRFRRGERRALEEVYRHYAPQVAAFLQGGFTFSSAGRHLRFSGYRQPFDLDNALQETFMRAFKESARQGYDGLNPYKNYLFGIARNLVLDELRSREAAMRPFFDEISGEGEGEGAAPPGGDGEQDLLGRELAQLYAAFVARLAERDRTFFRHRFEEQRTQVEAGELSGMSHMQARTLEKKLRRAFLEFMQANGYLEAYAASVAKVS
jgi:RNA polymerase sigma factor (sigma-70 family)